ncbi:MAG TPA: hypothetical protein VE889_07585, partial [Actinomycetota bacterium]|nr:hypothetical protein [Actinomycetota bacterium]
MTEQATQPVGEPFSAWPEFVAEAKAVIQAANDRGLHLRLLGALAVIEQCPGGVWLLEKTNRVLTDLDFMGYEKELGSVERMFGNLGYEMLGGRGVTMNVWVGRRIFHDPNGIRRRVDVFLDRLDFCHPIELTGRLELHPVTIPLTDILLEKLQIVEINEKDLKDLVVLFLEHPIADDRVEDAFDASYVVDLLSKEWGFFYTVSLNLDRVRRYMQTISDLTDGQRALVEERMDHLWNKVEAAPKRMKWKLRARVGT